MMKPTCLILTLAGVLFAAGEPATLTGVITDTLCGRTHAMMKEPSNEACVKMCVKGSGEYALFDGKNVLRLSDQKLPTKFAARRVKVTGAYDAKAGRINVTSIGPFDRSLRSSPAVRERAHDWHEANEALTRRIASARTEI